MAEYHLRINGIDYLVDCLPATPLLWVIREDLKLTGTKYGCGIGQCGVCTVHLNGQPIRSCSLPVSAVKEEVTTIEGLAAESLHPLQKVWIDEQVPQCGYCQSGQLMQAAALLKKNPSPSRKEIVNQMNGVLCRCGTYQRIVRAIQKASKKS